MRRNTIQKLIIKNKLMKTRDHPTAEQLFLEVKKEIPTITLATVYRNLNKMSEDGEIIRLEVNGEFHFDAHTEPHLHFVCEKCGRIMDFYDDNITNDITMISKKLSKNHGFEIKDSEIIIKGICNDCKLKENN